MFCVSSRASAGSLSRLKFKVQLGFDIRALGVVCYGGCVSVCVREQLSFWRRIQLPSH